MRWVRILICDCVFPDHTDMFVEDMLPYECMCVSFLVPLPLGVMGSHFDL